MKSSKYKDLSLYAINIHQKIWELWEKIKTKIRIERMKQENSSNWSNRERKRNCIVSESFTRRCNAEGKEPDPKVKLVASASDVHHRSNVNIERIYVVEIDSNLL